MDPSRRKILKASGTGIATTAVPFGVVGNAAADQSDKYVGLSYHTATHEAQGRAQATLRQDPNGRLSGTINAGGFTIPVGQDGKLTPSVTREGQRIYRGKSSKPAHMGDGLPLVYKLVDYGHFFIGHVTRPNPHYAKLGLTLNNTSVSISAADVRKTLRNQGRGRGSVQPNVPSTGIPNSVEPEE